MNKSPLFLIAITILFLYSCQEDTSLPGLETEVEANYDITVRRSCGSTDHTHKLCMDPKYDALHKMKLENARKFKSLKANCTTPVTIPVAIHYQGATNPDAACLRHMAQRQIDALNKDFRATNTDITKWTNEAAFSFPGISNGAACVTFAIANTNHPIGYGLNNGDPAVTVNQTTGDMDTKWTGYLNFYIQPQTGALGYAPLGGSGNGDGVVIDAMAWGMGEKCGAIGAEAPYNLGRTTTHEVGHYLLLDHIWGGGCGQDDEVSDTPDSAAEYYDCPNVEETSCGSVDMHMNYMDYTNDECMYMFSEGQASRMTNYVNASLTNLISNAIVVIDGEPIVVDENTGGDAGDETTGDQGGEETYEDEDTEEVPVHEEEEITIAITLDEYGSETKWKLKDESNQVIASGGRYQDGQSGTIIEDKVVIESGCYRLILTDEYGDGICCDYGDGQVEVYDGAGNLITYSDGYFGKRERLEFCKDTEGVYGRKGIKDRRAKYLAPKK